MNFWAMLVSYAVIALAIGVSFQRYLKRNRSEAAPWEIVNASGLWIFFVGWILCDLLRGKGLGPVTRPAGHPRVRVRVARASARGLRRPTPLGLSRPTLGFSGPVGW